MKKRKYIIDEYDSKYDGKFVAMPNFNDGRVVAFGEDPIKVIEEAKTLGHNNPVIFFCKDPKINYITSIFKKESYDPKN